MELVLAKILRAELILVMAEKKEIRLKSALQKAKTPIRRLAIPGRNHTIT
jgi:hypothetical protein